MTHNKLIKNDSSGGNKVFIIKPFLGRVQMFELQEDYFKLPS